MKKVLSMLICLVMIISSFAFTTSVLADDGINVVINGKEQTYDVMPVIVNGRTLVPMRAIFEALGAEVTWIEPTRTVVGSRDRKYIKLRIDSDTYYVDGIEQESKLDVPATIVNGRTMVPVRFIAESFGENVNWNGDTKTVEITSDYLTKVAVSDKLALLPSTLHREIPREFTKSNDIKDIIYYEEEKIEEIPHDVLSLLPVGNTVFSAEEFLNNFSIEKPGVNQLKTKWGYAERVAVEGQTFTEAMRVHTDIVPENTNQFVACFGNALEGKCQPGDKLLFTCKLRLVDGGEAGMGQIYPQIQELKTGNFKKILFKPAYITKNWHTVYFPIEYADSHDELAIRLGYCFAPQVIDIADVQIINYGQQVLGDYPLPSDDGSVREDYSNDSPWRMEALERIPQVRKGDFKVVVKDKDGNVIPDADVNFDMFESALPLGTTLGSGMLPHREGHEEYNRNMAKYFNGAVVEHNMKWGPYEEDDGKIAREIVNVARSNGMIYLRGHTMIMDYHMTNTPTILIPRDVVDNYDDIEYVDTRVKDWIYKVSDKFAGEIYQWDVVNEVITGQGSTETGIYRNIGPHYFDKIFKWAREMNPNSELFYLEGNRIYTDKIHYKNAIENFIKNENTFDSLGFQCHLGTKWVSAPEFDRMFNELVETYGGNIALTEFTIYSGDEIYDANYARDMFIMALANEHINTICLWGYRKSGEKSNKVIVNNDYSLTKAGEQILDLYYNKCFTHDAKVKTDAKGEGTINGFYGNYDVTVTHNGKTKTVMAAFHKGYENVLEITLD
ncbi:MAG: hypothetical protein E7396_03890 [Ruminococcaceae bacterium]|nr:hypothetical protein [Oscillospiraceae bacterium]